MSSSPVPADLFERACAISRLDEGQLALVRAVLIEGRSQTAVAREAGVSRQWVSKLVGRVRQLIEQVTPAPPGWIAATVVLPPDRWPAVREIERRARQEHQRRMRSIEEASRER